MPRLEEVANVALRVPSLLLLDMLFKCDVDGVTEHIRAKNDDMLFKYKYVIWNMYYLGRYTNTECVCDCANVCECACVCVCNT